MPSALVQLQLQSQVAPQIAQTASAYKTLSAEEQKAERAATSYAQSLQKVALADAKTATEEQRLAVQTANVAKAQSQAEAAALRLSRAQNQAASGNSFAAQTADAFKSSVIGIIGPMALATAAIGAVSATANSFKEAFVFKAQLDQSTASITAQLIGLRDSKQVFAEAAAFADKYKLTQEDTTTAIQASVPLLRQSKASLTDVLTVLSQLQVLKPEQGIQGAAFALAELQGGQSRSLATRFNIPIAKATEMKNEIQKGGDAVQVLGAYLDKAGIGADALSVRTKGAAGAMNDAAIAAEKLKIAQAEFGAGPGIAFLQTETTLLTGLTRLLNGDFVTGIQATVANQRAATAAYYAYTSAISDGKTKIEANAAAQAASNASLQQQGPNATAAAQAHNAYADAMAHGATQAQANAAAQRALVAATVPIPPAAAAATIGVLRSADADDRAADAAIRHAAALVKETSGLLAVANATGLADQRKGEQTGTDLSAAQFDKFSDLARKGAEDAAAAKKKVDDKAAADAARLDDLRTQNQLINAKTSGAKIAVLRAQLAKATNAIDRQSIQNQIDQEKSSGAGRVSAAESTALKLNDIARSSGDDRARIERENLEKLRDAQQDFDVRSSRAQEDYEEKRRKLLAGGQRAQAAALAADFAKDRRRAQEDFDRDRQRTLRNNREALGDQSTRVGNQVEGIAARTAARGGGAVSLPTSPGGGGGALPSLPSAPSRAGAAPTVAQINFYLDGKKFAEAIWTPLMPIVDQELAAVLQLTSLPGSGQAAVGGAG